MINFLGRMVKATVGRQDPIMLWNDRATGFLSFYFLIDAFFPFPGKRKFTFCSFFIIANFDDNVFKISFAIIWLLSNMLGSVI